MKYKMIASDLDGTLNNDNYVVSKENIRAIQKAVDSGLHFVLCSGRSPASLSSYAEKAGLNKKGHFGIGFNGSIVYEADTHKVLFQSCINKDLAIEIIKDIKSVSTDVKMLVYLEQNHIVVESDLEALHEEYKQDTAMKIQIVDNLEDHITKDVMSIALVDDNKILKKVSSEMQKFKNDSYNMVFTGAQYLEFLPVSANKAQGVAILAKHLGITLEEIVSVGDNYNDIEMIEETGIGIAVANAVQPLKSIANYVTKLDNNNHLMTEVVDMVLAENKKA